MAFNELETLCMLPHPGSILRVKATDIFATHASPVLQVKMPWDRQEGVASFEKMMIVDAGSENPAFCGNIPLR